MLDDDEASGSGAEMGSSPSQSIISGGSELFKSVLDDFVFDEARVSKIEFNRYKNKLKQDKHDEEHVKSRRCDSCQCVLAFCKCALYHGNERKFGHRVHWADEVWEKPLYTAFTDYLNHDSETDSEHEHDDGRKRRTSKGNNENKTANNDKIVQCKTDFHSMPKPILKHKPTCIVIVSD
ncbi:uncharacterized protein LOC128214405 [Mya arenaria]|uniref:uncharacterized protein LOC128214405 n=1 Tax=Mya arenaria TaxID=6604 RepID=UPI0022E64472|nr:uncharacterized protein LOC128214405 [Mya arenaria]